MTANKDRVIYVSPSEPDSLKLHFISSSFTEKYGVDICWATTKGFVGIQRKTPEDLVASIRDGRIGKQAALSESLSNRAIFLEGYPSFTISGEFMSDYITFSRTQWDGVMFSLMNDGWWVVQCRDRVDLIDKTIHLYDWSKKAKHTSLKTRPGPKKDTWKRISNKSWGVHILTSIPGIGAGTAENILNVFGRVPLAWDVDQTDLLTVKGIGKGTLEKMNKYIRPTQGWEED